MEFVKDVGCGSIAGIVGKCFDYPFDTVKVRLQSQPDHVPSQYNGPIDCFRQSVKLDGLRGLYRGIGAPVTGAAFETSSLFFFESIGRQTVYLSGWCSTDEALPLTALWYTGAFSGAFTSFILTPIELVKCRIQISTHRNTESARLKPPKILSVIRQVYVSDGFLGFWQGQTGTFLREVGGTAAWFGAKETTTKLFYLWNDERTSSQEKKASMRNRPLPLWQQAVAGASAGMSYNFLFFPADTVKSRMQTSASTMSLQRKTFWEEAVILWSQHGLRGLYRGCGMTVMRSAPTSALIFIIYDELRRRFQGN